MKMRPFLFATKLFFLQRYTEFTGDNFGSGEALLSMYSEPFGFASFYDAAQQRRHDVFQLKALGSQPN